MHLRLNFHFFLQSQLMLLIGVLLLASKYDLWNSDSPENLLIAVVLYEIMVVTVLFFGLFSKENEFERAVYEFIRYTPFVAKALGWIILLIGMYYLFQSDQTTYPVIIVIAVCFLGALNTFFGLITTYAPVMVWAGISTIDEVTVVPKAVQYSVLILFYPSIIILARTMHLFWIFRRLTAIIMFLSWVFILYFVRDIV